MSASVSVVIIKRPPRIVPPAVPDGEVKLETPPEIPREGDESMLMNLLPMMGMLGSVGFFFMPNLPSYMRVVGGLMLASTLAMAIAQFAKSRQGGGAGMAQDRRDYFRYLEQVRKDVHKTAELQRQSQLFQHPDPEQLWAVAADGKRLWERRPTDADFASVRIGRGVQQLNTPLVAPETAPKEELEPLTAAAMKAFLDAHGSLSDLPVAISLRAFYHVTICGETDTVYGSARSTLSQLATLHSPEDMMIAVVAHPPRRRTGTGSSGCRTASTRRPRTERARPGSSSTTSVSWRRRSRTSWTTGPAGTVRPTPSTTSRT